MSENAAFRLIAGSVVLVRVEGRDALFVEREIDRYALQYVTDEGSVMVQERVGKRWHPRYILAKREPS